MRASNCKRRRSEFVRKPNAESLSTDRRSNDHAYSLIVEGCQRGHPRKCKRSMNGGTPCAYPVSLDLCVLCKGNHSQNGCDEEKCGGSNYSRFQSYSPERNCILWPSGKITGCDEPNSASLPVIFFPRTSDRQLLLLTYFLVFGADVHDL